MESYVCHGRKMCLQCLEQDFDPDSSRHVRPDSGEPVWGRRRKYENTYITPYFCCSQCLLPPFPWTKIASDSRQLPTAIDLQHVSTIWRFKVASWQLYIALCPLAKHAAEASTALKKFNRLEVETLWSGKVSRFARNISMFVGKYSKSMLQLWPCGREGATQPRLPDIALQDCDFQFAVCCTCLTLLCPVCEHHGLVCTHD